MKHGTRVLFFLLPAFCCHAQSKQVQSLLEQITAIISYAKTAEKGYELVHSGLTTIKDIKNGDFNLHSDHFSELTNVSPAVRQTSQINDIVSFQLQIVRQANKIEQYANESKQFTSEELKYFKTVCDHLLSECSKNLDDLQSVVTSGELQMTDDERLKRINEIYDDMQDKLAFVKSFSKNISLLAIQRMAAQNDINHSRILTGIR